MRRKKTIGVERHYALMIKIIIIWRHLDSLIFSESVALFVRAAEGLLGIFIMCGLHETGQAPEHGS